LLHCLDGSINVAPTPVFTQPTAQALALVHWLALLRAQHLPSNHASNGNEKNGERDLDPLLHGNIMSRDAVKIENVAPVGSSAVPAMLAQDSD
jgi:hypothetical protein